MGVVRAPMMEEVAPRIFRVLVPLPNKPAKVLNSYFVLGEPRNLVVDTGLDRPECLEVMTQGLQALDMDPQRTDYFITHLHPDHLGLAARIASPASRIFFGLPDAETVQAEAGWEGPVAYARRNGFPPEVLEATFKDRPGHRYGSDWLSKLRVVRDGDLLPVGGYRFTCLATPGHTPGHTCLWEEGEGMLISGDHILDEVTPNVQCWADDLNPLASYLDSLERVARRKARLTLPGHRGLIPDCRQRIAELREHHRRRLDQVLALLAAGPLDAYQTASRMSWNIKDRSWGEFSVSQRWLAFGEAIAHLRYLEAQHRVRRTGPAGPITYRLAG